MIFSAAVTTSVFWNQLFHMLFYHLNFQGVIFLLQLEDSILSSQHRHFQIHSLLKSREVLWRWRRRAGGSQSVFRGTGASAKLQAKWFWNIGEGNIWFDGRCGCGGVSVKLKLCQLMFVWEWFNHCVLTSIFITAEKKTNTNLRLNKVDCHVFYFFSLHMCLSTVSSEKITKTRKIYWSYVKLAPSLNSCLVTGPFICVLRCSTHTNGSVTKHELPVLLTFIKCDSRVLKLLQNARQIHHGDHYLRHSTEVSQRNAVCGWKIMCCIKHILTNLRKQICINNKKQVVLTGTNQSFLSFDFLSCLCQEIFPLFVTVRNGTLNLWEGGVDGSSYVLPGIPFILGKDSSAAFPSDYVFFLLH